MPKGISFDEAGIVPMAAQTSLSALRDVGELKPNETVLVIGAAGGLGVYAIQIAKVLGLRLQQWGGG